MRSWIRFFREEKLYTLLLIALVFIYAGMMLAAEPGEEEGIAAEGLEQLRESEIRMHQDLTDIRSFEQFVQKRPKAARTYQTLIIATSGVFALGVLVHLLFLFQPGLRQRLNAQKREGSSLVWQFSMLVKALILFAAASLLLGFTVRLIQDYGQGQVSENLLILTQTLLADLLCLGIMVYVLRGYGGGFRDLGFSVPRRDILKEGGIGVLGYLGVFPVFMVVLFILVLAAHFFAFEPPPHPLVGIFIEEEARAPWIFIFSVCLAVLLGPILEEIFFRGYCYPILKAKWGKGTAMAGSSVFFALIHHNVFAFLPIWFLGMALAYLYEKRKCLIAPIVLHVCHNATFIVYFFLTRQILG